MVPDRLSTKRHTLRRFGRRDTASLEEAVRASLPELSRWLPWAYPGYGRDDAVAFVRESMEAWRTGNAYDFAIRDPDGFHLSFGKKVREVSPEEINAAMSNFATPSQ